MQNLLGISFSQKTFLPGIPSFISDLNCDLRSFSWLPFSNYLHALMGFPWGSAGKESACNVGWVRSLGWEDPLEKGKAMHSNILTWRIIWTEELADYRPRDRKSQTKLRDLYTHTHSNHSIIFPNTVLVWMWIGTATMENRNDIS